MAALKEYKEADAALNVAYKKLVAILHDDQKKQLVKAQQAWIKFRDCEAEFLSTRVSPGQMQNEMFYLMAADVTAQRTKQLNEARKDFQEEMK